MRKCLIAAVMLSAAVVFASCERNDNSVPECNLAISMGSDGNTVRVSVAPSDESVDYLYGIIMEDDYAALGEDGLVSYINDLISEGAELKQDLLQSCTAIFSGIRVITPLLPRSMTEPCTGLPL